MHQASHAFHNPNQAGVDVFETFAGAAFAGIERLAALNLNTARSLLEQGAANSRALLTAEDAQELLAVQNRLAQADSRKAAEYSRRVYEIASQTRDSVSKLVESQVSELNQTFGEALELAAGRAPVGSEAAVDSLRSALTAANAAFDAMGTAARQANDVAKANLAVLASLLFVHGRSGNKAGE